MMQGSFPYLKWYVFCMVMLIALLAMVAPAGAADVTITASGNSADDIANMNAAISAAGSGESVILNPGTYYLHDISIGKAITIRANTAAGGTAENTVIDAQSLGRIFYAGDNALTIDNLTLQNGVGPMGSRAGKGGAIYTDGGSVTVTSSTISDCQAPDNSISGDGGAINTYSGSVTVMSSTISNCRASDVDGEIQGGRGGAINTYSGSVTVTSSTISNCRAGYSTRMGNPYIFPGHGGAIYTNSGSVTVTSSTITGCRAGNSNSGHGGAIYTEHGSGTVRFSRLIGNYASGEGDTFVGPIAARDNWWGSNDGPFPGNLTFGASAPTWLVLGVTASPSAILPSGTSAIRTNLTFNSSGYDTSSAGHVQDGIPVAFSINPAGYGALSVTGGNITMGANLSRYDAPVTTGTATITVTVDSQSVSVPVVVRHFPITSIAVDPIDSGSVYAGSDGLGIWRSTSGGSTWSEATAQPGNLNIRALVISPLDRTHLFAGTYGNGVYKSTDSGVTWTACANTGLADQKVLSLVSDKNGRLFAGTEGGTESGMYMSNDNCASWTALGAA